MASSKQKTTMNKLNRERKLRERRLDKEARKVARMNAPADTEARPGDPLQDELGEPAELTSQPAPAGPIS
jgi:hypothetical protein